MWIVVIILLICLIEQQKMASDPNFTFMKILFEVVSAFGNVGSSLGHPSVSASFSAVFSPVSKLLIILTIILGRHRGFAGSMRDQEEHLQREDGDEDDHIMGSAK